MKICIVGAGAIGSYLACRLSRTDSEICVLARGTRAVAIRSLGITTTFEDGERVVVRPTVAETADSLGTQRYVFVCVKAYSVPEVALSLGPLLDPDTHVVFLQNGIPWWYFAGMTGDGSMDLLDPAGRIAATVRLERVVGCVTYANVRNVAPGIAQHISDDSFVLGSPVGEITQPLEALSALLAAAGIDVRITERIRDEIWLKLWGSLAFNPISALTGMTMDEIISDPATRPTVVAMMAEARAVAERYGVSLRAGIDKRLETASKAGRFKTSMLQDLEAGRRLEIDAIIGAVAEAAKRVDVKTPTIDAVLGLLRQKARGLGLN